MNRAIKWAAANPGLLALGAGTAGVSMVFAALVGLHTVFVAPLLVATGVATWGIYRWRSRGLDPPPVRAPISRVASSALAATLAVALAAQAVPYGRDHSNPPITGEPAWATPETRALVVRACFDCHSNEVQWPWYSNIAPLSWAVTKHVEDGRSTVNYQEWDRPQREADESFDEVRKGAMPPGYYTFGGLHRGAKLTGEEMEALLAGLRATPGLSD